MFCSVGLFSSQQASCMESRAPSEAPKGRKKQQPFSEQVCPMAKVYINSIITYLSIVKIQIEHGNIINVNLYIWSLGKFSKHLNLQV